MKALTFEQRDDLRDLLPYSEIPEWYHVDAVEAFYAPIIAARIAESRREGWVSFGTHAGLDSLPLLEFSDEEDDTGMPLWERIDSGAGLRGGGLT